MVRGVSPGGKAGAPAGLTSSFFLFLFLFGFTVLPVVQSLKIIVSYILYGFLIVYCGRVNVVYVISSRQKEKSHLAFDY